MLLDGGHARLRVTPARRALLAVAAAGLAVLLLGAPAGAHNQRTAFLGDYGPYDVVASVRDRDRPGQDGVLLEVVVRTRGSRLAVDEAELTVTADGGGTSVGPVPVEQYGNVYRVVLPGDDVTTWDVEIELTGPPGSTSIAEEVPGPRTLHEGSLLGGVSAPSGGWLVLAAIALVGLPLLGFTPWWRPVMWGAALVLIATCTIASWQVWTGSTTEPAERAGLLPVALLVALLASGLLLTRRRRDDARGLVFAGSAGLAVLVGWVNREALSGTATASVLTPTVARAVASLALGLGGGLALLMVVTSRAQIRDLVTPRRDRPASRTDPTT